MRFWAEHLVIFFCASFFCSLPFYFYFYYNISFFCFFFRIVVAECWTPTSCFFFRFSPNFFISFARMHGACPMRGEKNLFFFSISIDSFSFSMGTYTHLTLHRRKMTDKFMFFYLSERFSIENGATILMSLRFYGVAQRKYEII